MRKAGPGHIFLSHHAQDKPQVEALARQLLDRGLRPWLDKWEIAAGPPGRRRCRAPSSRPAPCWCAWAHTGWAARSCPKSKLRSTARSQDRARLVIPAAAAPLLERASQRWTELAGPPPRATPCSWSSRTRASLAELLRERGEPLRAAAELQRALELTVRILEREPTHFEARSTRVSLQLALAAAQEAAALPADTRQSRARALAAATEHARLSPTSSEAQRALEAARERARR